MTNETDKLENARRQGQAQFDSIREMVAALECDYDRLEELRDARESLVWDVENAESDEEKEQAHVSFSAWESENDEDLKLLESEAGDCKDAEEARERIEQDALSVDVRSDWHTPGDEDSKPSQFRILLCTGGPAVQIRGELNDYMEPSRAWLEVQDWFVPWEEMYLGEGSQDILLAYARCFYFGERTLCKAL